MFVRNCPKIYLLSVRIRNRCSDNYRIPKYRIPTGTSSIHPLALPIPLVPFPAAPHVPCRISAIWYSRKAPLWWSGRVLCHTGWWGRIEITCQPTINQEHNTVNTAMSTVKADKTVLSTILKTVRRRQHNNERHHKDIQQGETQTSSTTKQR